MYEETPDCRFNKRLVSPWTWISFLGSRSTRRISTYPSTLLNTYPSTLLILFSFSWYLCILHQLPVLTFLLLYFNPDFPPPSSLNLSFLHIQFIYSFRLCKLSHKTFFLTHPDQYNPFFSLPYLISNNPNNLNLIKFPGAILEKDFWTPPPSIKKWKHFF